MKGGISGASSQVGRSQERGEALVERLKAAGGATGASEAGWLLKADGWLVHHCATHSVYIA